MKMLSKKQLIALQDESIKETGGSTGIRDEGLLESALAAPFASFGGEHPYPTIEAKGQGSALGWSKIIHLLME